MTHTPKTSTNGPKAPVFKAEALNKALVNFEDIMERCLINKWLVLGETARSIKDEVNLEGNGIDVAIKDLQATHEVISNFRTYTKAEPAEDGFTYFVDEVPVRVKFLHRKYKFFEYPDQKLYQPVSGFYMLPNPFEKYWKARFLIK